MGNRYPVAVYPSGFSAQFRLAESMNTSKTFVDRRSFLEGAAGVAVVAVCGGSFAIARYDDYALIDDLSRRCFLYFWDATDPETGICRDLIHGNPADNARKGDESRGSTGVTGFALTALCIGAERKWIAREQAKDRVRRTRSVGQDRTRSVTDGAVCRR
jgi:hypothetical protein